MINTFKFFHGIEESDITEIATMIRRLRVEWEPRVNEDIRNNDEIDLERMVTDTLTQGIVEEIDRGLLQRLSLMGGNRA